MKKEILVFIALVVIGAIAALGASKLEDRNSPENISLAAWSTFDVYVEAARTHDLASLTTVSHQLSPACLDATREVECFALMDSVYSIASSLDKTGFKYVETDSKQIVMWTDGPGVAILYFTREGRNAPKVLGLQFCLEIEAGDPCVERETLKNDGDEDGWWDKTEELFY